MSDHGTATNNPAPLPQTSLGPPGIRAADSGGTFPPPARGRSPSAAWISRFRCSQDEVEVWVLRLSSLSLAFAGTPGTLGGEEGSLGPGKHAQVLDVEFLKGHKGGNPAPPPQAPRGRRCRDATSDPGAVPSSRRPVRGHAPVLSVPSGLGFSPSRRLGQVPAHSNGFMASRRREGGQA